MRRLPKPKSLCPTRCLHAGSTHCDTDSNTYTDDNTDSNSHAYATVRNFHEHGGNLYPR